MRRNWQIWRIFSHTEVYYTNVNTTTPHHHTTSTSQHLTTSTLFDLIEALSEDALAECLRNDGVGVDRLDYGEHLLRLVLAREDDEHIYIVLAVPALALDERYAAAHVGVDGIGNLLILLRDNEELHRLARTIDDIVANDGGYEREGDTVDDGLHAAEEQVRGADDGAVDELHGATEAHVEVLVEQYGDDIGATGRTIMREDQTQAGTTHRTTYEHVHELVLARRDDRVCLEERL